MFRTRVSLWDFFAAGLVLAAAVLMLVLPPLLREEATVLVISTPESTWEYSLSEDRTVTVSSREITLSVLIENGQASVTESNCSDGVCRSSGRISQSGETILCAPAGIRLFVRGGALDVDFVAG